MGVEILEDFKGEANKTEELIMDWGRGLGNASVRVVSFC